MATRGVVRLPRGDVGRTAGDWGIRRLKLDEIEIMVLGGTVGGAQSGPLQEVRLA